MIALGNSLPAPACPTSFPTCFLFRTSELVPPRPRSTFPNLSSRARRHNRRTKPAASHREPDGLVSEWPQASFAKLGCQLGRSSIFLDDPLLLLLRVLISIARVFARRVLFRDFGLELKPRVRKSGRSEGFAGGTLGELRPLVQCFVEGLRSFAAGLEIFVEQT